MNTYETYVRATESLCASTCNGIRDLVRFNSRVSRLYNKIRKSQLTVYQKDSLLQLLDHTREATMAGHVAAVVRGVQFATNSAAKQKNASKPAAAKHQKATLLAA